MKHVSLVAGLILVGGALAGCGSDDAPTDASDSDFCASYLKAQKMDSEGATGADVRDWAGDLEETGTPKDISEEERKGFELLIKWAKDVDEDAKAEDIEDPDISDEEQKQFDAFGQYVSTTCQDEIEKSMEELMPEEPDSSGLESPELPDSTE